MPTLSEKNFESEVAKRLAELTGVGPVEITVEPGLSANGTSKSHIDFTATAGNLVFAVECKHKGDAATVGKAIRAVSAAAKAMIGKKAIPLLVVPYMGEVGSRLCEEAGVSWLDLSGNAALTGRPGLRIRIEGKPNRFKSSGRPRNLFAPKSARIARCLLTAPDQAFSQRELAEQSGLDEGFTSRIVRGMEAKELIRRNASGSIILADPGIMLEAWREVYDFDKHTILRGHVPVRSGIDLLKKSAKTLKRHGQAYAATGLAGTWLVNPFAGFRLTVLYLEKEPTDALRADLGFQEETRGANLWLVRPNDAGVFHGAREVDAIRCVHPVQLYLDLKNHPERATEAAQALKSLIIEPQCAHG